MTILDCCISFKMIKNNLVELGVVDMHQLLLNRYNIDLETLSIVLELRYNCPNLKDASVRLNE